MVMSFTSEQFEAHTTVLLRIQPIGCWTSWSWPNNALKQSIKPLKTALDNRWEFLHPLLLYASSQSEQSSCTSTNHSVLIIEGLCIEPNQVKQTHQEGLQCSEIPIQLHRHAIDEPRHSSSPLAQWGPYCIKTVFRVQTQLKKLSFTVWRYSKAMLCNFT